MKKRKIEHEAQKALKRKSQQELLKRFELRTSCAEAQSKQCSEIKGYDESHECHVQAQKAHAVK